MSSSKSFEIELVKQWLRTRHWKTQEWNGIAGKAESRKPTLSNFQPSVGGRANRGKLACCGVIILHISPNLWNLRPEIEHKMWERRAVWSPSWWWFCYWTCCCSLLPPADTVVVSNMIAVDVSDLSKSDLIEADDKNGFIVHNGKCSNEQID